MNEINSTEAGLRAEIEQLKRQLEEQKKLAGGAHPAQPTEPSGRTLVVLALLASGLMVAGFFLGYIPRQRREQVLAAEARTESRTLPVANVQLVGRSDTRSNLVLPGNIEAVTEAPILARASGYIRKRYVDIGDRVQAGQVLAGIEAPELEQQIRQAEATVGQANAAVEQARASLQQGHANENLARVTAARNAVLLKKGVVSRQDNDNFQAQWQAQQANVQALEKAVTAALSNASAVEANLARLKELVGYLQVRAPFDGVITVRNVDVGVLVNEGSTLLYRIAQTDRLRTYVNLPQSDADSVRAGQHAVLEVPDLPGRRFDGLVKRTANALDPSTRTLLAEIEVPNPSGTLMPGMYAQVDLSVPRKDPPLVIPGDTLVVRSDGPQVAVVAPDGRVHYTRIKLGRDFGDRLEVLDALKEGQLVVVNPSDAIREGVTVRPVMSAPVKRP